MELCAAATSETISRSYVRRAPEHGVLHRVVRDHLQTFLWELDRRELERGAPSFVKPEFQRFVRCGVLAHGFARFRCTGCGTDRLVAFSCKGRGFCSSCGGRRMTERAAHLVDHVLPRTPVRQWVLSLPFELRYRLAHREALGIRRNEVLETMYPIADVPWGRVPETRKWTRGEGLIAKLRWLLFAINTSFEGVILQRHEPTIRCHNPSGRFPFVL